MAHIFLVVFTMNSFYRSLSFVAVLGLTACQSVLDAPTQHREPTIEIAHNDPQWQQHLTHLDQIQHYQTKGQFGYISVSPKERFSSVFDFNYQTPTHFSLSLSSNLSSQSLKLHRTPRGLTVSDEKGRSRTESDVQKLVKEIIGVAFPIDQFAYWLKGKPEQNSHYKVNAQRHLAQFTHQLDGQTWTANYVEYHTDLTPALPKLIVLESGDKTLKIRIDQWQF